MSSPDHAALIVNLGAAYRITGRLRIVSDVKYEPFPSTAEVRRIQYPDDDLESNFHLLVIASGVSLRF
jgi:outer membrane protein W